MNKKFWWVIIAIVIVITVFLVVNFNSNRSRVSDNLSCEITFEFYKLNYCETDSDCLIGCSSTLHPCWELHFYNKYEDLSNLNGLFEKCWMLKKDLYQIVCFVNTCYDFENGNFNDVNISCVNNICFSNSDNKHYFRSEDIICSK